MDGSRRGFHGVKDGGGPRALMMELVEGQTLARDDDRPVLKSRGSPHRLHPKLDLRAPSRAASRDQGCPAS